MSDINVDTTNTRKCSDCEKVFTMLLETNTCPHCGSTRIISLNEWRAELEAIARGLING